MAFPVDFPTRFPQRNPTDPPYVPPPADPDAPGLNPVDANPGPNHFNAGLMGPDPNLAVGGSHDQQEHQRNVTVSLAVLALESYATGHTPVTDRSPPDSQVQTILDGLQTNPPIGEDGEDVTHIVYQSEIPNATAADAYAHFVNNPDQVFSAGGMEIRPPADRLVDGGRYMLEIGGPVPTWLPIEIRLDPSNNAITINTLDGHVLRGEQTFTFTDDGNGGAALTQDARFQASSELPGELQELTSISGGQHMAWEYAHREIYEQFNGNRDYEGMGTGLFNKQQLAAWSETLMNFVTDPGNAVDTGIDVTGELANWGIDMGGEGIEAAFDWLGIPGGDRVSQAFDTVGDWVSNGADWVGDRAEDVVNFVKNPFGVFG